jgi:5-methylcytosine-specific restriction endonuclease McrA
MKDTELRRRIGREYSKRFQRPYNNAPWKIRLQVYERDNYTCVKCGAKGVPGKAGVGKIQAHHIVPYRSGGEHSLDNMITLCSACHKIADKEQVKTGMARARHGVSMDWCEDDDK